MKLKPLRYRQIHLDFHTSEKVPNIGGRFNAKQFVETLRAAEVDSITLFAKCHHGWSYHPTRIGKQHPELSFDLLRAQYEAVKEAGIQAPIYLSAGVDNVASYEHPEWREVGPDGAYTGWAKRSIDPGFHMMDFHSPYLEYLCDQIREVCELFPECDGIFLDIISQGESCSRWALDFMRKHGLDPRKEEDRRESARQALLRYYRETVAAAQCLNPDMPMCHHAGHIYRGDRTVLPFFSHLELESLPTGGWGYDHFPMSAKYACNLDHDFLGMSGKFHTTWGEFGGFKHPNALRYECAAMLAFGAKCSIGDQLHPSGEIDRATYELIGTAYREVKAKEPWCEGAKQQFDIAILSAEAEHLDRSSGYHDEGACRILLEEHFLFGLVDREMDFTPYRAIVLPDVIRIDDALKAKLDAYLAQGGKLILSGASGLWKDREEMAFDLGATFEGPSPFSPDYILPDEAVRPDFVSTPQVMYRRSYRIKPTKGESLGDIYDPYFNREFDFFCSHQHTPNQPTPSGYAAGVQYGAILYFAHPVFENYRAYGAVAYREFVGKAIRRFLGEEISLTTNLPSTGRVTVTRQEAPARTIVHLLHATPVVRCGSLAMQGGNLAAEGRSVEVIEEILPLYNVEVSLKGTFSKATLQPQGEDLALITRDGASSFLLPKLECHQMVVLE